LFYYSIIKKAFFNYSFSKVSASYRCSKQFFLKEGVITIKSLMNPSSRFFLFLLLLFGILEISQGNAQGGNLLIQQYQKGPALDGNYSRWSLQPGVQLYYLNTDLETTRPKLALGALLQIEYRVSSTVGFTTGVHDTRIAYSYPVQDSIGVDKLHYWSIPLGIQLHPTHRVNLGLGAHYNVYNKGHFLRIIEEFKSKTPYPKEHFKNTFGGVVQVGYRFFKKCYAYLNFRWATRSNPPTQPQTNTTSGFQLGITYTLWTSKKRR